MDKSQIKNLNKCYKKIKICIFQKDDEVLQENCLNSVFIAVLILNKVIIKVIKFCRTLDIQFIIIQ
jgi:hypothetical protein